MRSSAKLSSVVDPGDRAWGECVVFGDKIAVRRDPECCRVRNHPERLRPAARGRAIGGQTTARPSGAPGTSAAGALEKEKKVVTR